MSYSLSKGDLEPEMLITLGAPGAQQALATALSVNLRWTRPDGTTTTVPLVVVDTSAFKVKRVWVTGDSDQVGAHFGQVVITTADNKETCDPNDGSRLIWWVYKALGT